MFLKSQQYDELKRKLRKLKKLELKLRFGREHPAGQPVSGLVWDTFFDLHNQSTGGAKYSLLILAAMSRGEYRDTVNEFFFEVYYTYYWENGMLSPDAFEPKILSQMGLTPDTDEAAVKRKFHELALKYHPDTGGDAEKFIALMEDYRKLIEKGR